MDAAEDAAEEEEVEEDCSSTVVATGAEAATSGAEEDTSGDTDDGDGDDDEPAAGTLLWDDILPGILGKEHTSHLVMSSWFWNVQRLQVHCSPVLARLLVAVSFNPMTGADTERPVYRPSIVYDVEVAGVADC